MGLNCMGPVRCGFFSVNTIALHNPRLAESMDVDPHIQRATVKSHMDFQLRGMMISVIHGSTVLNATELYT